MTAADKIQKLLDREQERLDEYKKAYKVDDPLGAKYVIEQQDKILGILMALKEIIE